MVSVRAEKTKLINKAVLRLRHPGYTSTELDFDTPGNNSERIDKLVVDTFDDVVNEILESRPWVAMSKIDDSLDSINSHNNEFFAYAYKLPSDYVRLVGEPYFSGSPVHYSVGRWTGLMGHYRVAGYESGGQRVLETSFTTPGIRYVYLTAYSNPNSDPDDYYNLLPEYLRQAIVARCRVEWAYGITGEPKMEMEMQKMFELQMRRSTHINNQELATLKRQSDSLNYARVK